MDSSVMVKEYGEDGRWWLYVSLENIMEHTMSFKTRAPGISQVAVSNTLLLMIRSSPVS